MRAHVEPVVSILRVFEDDRKFGDPYVWSAVVRHRYDERTIEIGGVDKPVTPSIWRAVIRLCQESGIRRIEFERNAGAKPGRRTIRVPLEISNGRIEK